jgi:hypothetical protein
MQILHVRPTRDGLFHIFLLLIKALRKSLTDIDRGSSSYITIVKNIFLNLNFLNLNLAKNCKVLATPDRLFVSKYSLTIYL